MTEQTHCAHGYRLDEKCQRCDDECAREEGYSPIVNRPPDDGKGRVSAYDTTWPDMFDEEKRRLRRGEGMEILHDYLRSKGRM